MNDRLYDALPPIIVLMLLGCAMLGWVLGRQQGRLEASCECACGADSVAAVHGMACSCLTLQAETGR